MRIESVDPTVYMGIYICTYTRHEQNMSASPQDYSVPEIGLFPEENAEGKKVVFRDTSEDARIFGFPIKANSIIINAGL